MKFKREKRKFYVGNKEFLTFSDAWTFLRNNLERN